MGVHGLWELLAPVGRRVSVETLAGKKLAIDASIWMIQFMKAMRDERGEMVRNAHILGFFRRICKLLFLRTKPVFVFDGGTPALKRRTVIARRRQRENAQGKIRKTAEKLLLNHLKAMRLKELAKDLEKQRQSNDVKGKKAVVEEPSTVQETGKGNGEGAMSLNQEELDAMLAASLAAEETEGFHGDASTSGAGAAQDEHFGDEDEDEELIIPEMHGKIDPAVLASLPPSMQLDLLVQMRERLMAENREKYQKVKKAPARFSELQIQAYLKTVAFRREIDGVQKSAAAGRGIGGVQTSRIASEANREFIFSSSFTGDKQAFTSVGQEKTDPSQSHPSPVTLNNNTAHVFAPPKSSGSAAGPTQPETSKAFNDDVGTYTDERGRLRVNRVRALGIRMTRDLQRNLDLMKEIEQEKMDTNQTDIERTDPSDLADLLVKSPERILHKVTDDINDGMNDEVDATEEPAIMKGTSIEVSFEDTCDHRSSNEDDDLFALLVAGEPVMDFSVNNPTPLIETLQSTSDCEWEEGVIEDKVEGHPTLGGISDEGEIEWEEGAPDSQLKITTNQDEKNENGDGSDVEWEEGHQDTHLKSSHHRDTVSRGALEEEAAFQEAIRRSLNDVADGKFMNELPKDDEPEIAREKVSQNIGEVPLTEEKVPQYEALVTDISQPVEPTQITNILETSDLKETLHASTGVSNEENNLDHDVLSQDGRVAGTLAGEILSPLDTLPEERLSSLTGKGRVVSKLVGNSSGEVAVNSNDAPGGYSFSNLRPGSLLNTDPSHSDDAFPAKLDDNTFQTSSVGNMSANDLVTEADDFVGKRYGDISAEKEPAMEPSIVDGDENYEDMDARLEEEMSFLEKERDQLGHEQRKLERNAESVSSEMFVECQELLQMFGLPYIIAPMEAEAQCAFMELSNLVDGVVTDDSDAFLFGARSVYKNIFDDRKYVETYLMKDIENELGLDREKLIHMALLLGSDYTEGVSGIGIVNAIEVVNAFPEKDGLLEFREWIESPDPTILGKLDVKGGNSKRKLPKTGEAAISSSSTNLDEISSDQSVRESQDEAARRRFFMETHRNVSKNWHIPSSFPSDAVISAYASPQVDKSTEPFAWGKPDLSVLRKLCWEKFSWATSKADDLLLPVLKEYNKHETQLRLEAFYTFNERFAKIKSKRVKKALKGIAGDKSSELVDGMPQQSGSGKKRKGKPSVTETDQSGVNSTGLESTDTGNQTSSTVKSAAKQSKGKQTKEKRLKIGLEASSNVSTSRNTKKETRGRGRGQVHGRGREENNHSSEDTETSHERDGDLLDELSGPHEVRRSGRTRKTVNYDEFGDLEAEKDNCVSEGATAHDSLGSEAVDAIQTGADQLEEGKPIQPEVGGENEQAYDMNMIDAIQTDFSSVEDHFDQGESAKDYLQSGGGFCAEEDEQNGDGTNPSSPSKELIPEEPSDLNSVDNETDQPVIAPIVNEKLDDLLNEDDENESETRYAGSLRAMPNLRKKRRRT